jgi:hypothetical protein
MLSTLTLPATVCLVVERWIEIDLSEQIQDALLSMATDVLFQRSVNRLLPGFVLSDADSLLKERLVQCKIREHT